MKTKNQLARVYIIDRELSKKRFVKSKELQKIISWEYIPVSDRSIQKDINFMKEALPSGFAAPIEYDKKKKAYYYTDRNFTIQAFGLRDDDIVALSFYAKTLEQYKGVKIFDDILQAVEKVISVQKLPSNAHEIFSKKSILLTPKFTKTGGVNYLDSILKAIISEQEIEFDYKKFEDDVSNKRTLQPILLKEDKNFWYVLGTIPGKQELTTFALDRISNLKVINKYFAPLIIDFAEYFKYSFGITVSSEKPKKIVMSFTPNQGKYVKAVPIHETQNIIKDNDKELRISVEVKPSYEFYSKILSYGCDVKIISPKTIKDAIIKKLKLSLINYK